MDDMGMSWKTFWVLLVTSLITLILFICLGDWGKVIEVYSIGLICLGIAAFATRLYLSWTDFLSKVSTDFGTLENLYEQTKKNQSEVYSELQMIRSMVGHQSEKNDALKSAVVAALKKLHEVSKNAPQSKADEARKQVLWLNE